jgi:hypothetical protein
MAWSEFGHVRWTGTESLIGRDEYTYMYSVLYIHLLQGNCNRDISKYYSILQQNLTACLNTYT